MTPPNGGELAANAIRALEYYSALAHKLETEIATLRAQRDMVREFIAALTAAPRPARKPRVVEPIASGDGEEQPEAPQTDTELAG